MEKTHKELLKENKILRNAIMDFHYMARRYADGRMTMVSHIVNDHTYKLLKMGVPLFAERDGGFFAHDGQENLEKNCFCIPKYYLDLERKIIDEHNKKN